MTPIFITGGTGYIGKRLIKQLVERGYDATALVRKGSESKLPPGVRAIIGDPFDAASFQNWIPKGATFIHLLGSSSPPSRKQEQFRSVDLQSVKASAEASVKAGVSHFVYLSVVMADKSAMNEFREVRKEAETLLLSKSFACTFIRPGYVIGPGRFWPLFRSPLFGLSEMIASLKQQKAGSSIVTIKQLLNTLDKAIESPPQRLRVFEINHMKRNSLPAI